MQLTLASIFDLSGGGCVLLSLIGAAVLLRVVFGDSRSSTSHSDGAARSDLLWQDNELLSGHRAAAEFKRAFKQRAMERPEVWGDNENSGESPILPSLGKDPGFQPLGSFDAGPPSSYAKSEHRLGCQCTRCINERRSYGREHGGQTSDGASPYTTSTHPSGCRCTRCRGRY